MGVWLEFSLRQKTVLGRFRHGNNISKSARNPPEASPASCYRIFSNFASFRQMAETAAGSGVPVQYFGTMGLGLCTMARTTLPAAVSAICQNETKFEKMR